MMRPTRSAATSADSMRTEGATTSAAAAAATTTTLAAAASATTTTLAAAISEAMLTTLRWPETTWRKASKPLATTSAEATTTLATTTLAAKSLAATTTSASSRFGSNPTQTTRLDPAVPCSTHHLIMRRVLLRVSTRDPACATRHVPSDYVSFLENVPLPCKSPIQ